MADLYIFSEGGQHLRWAYQHPVKDAADLKSKLDNSEGGDFSGVYRIDDDYYHYDNATSVLSLFEEEPTMGDLGYNAARIDKNHWHFTGRLLDKIPHDHNNQPAANWVDISRWKISAFLWWFYNSRPYVWE